MLGNRCGVCRVMVHIMAEIDLLRSAMAAPVMGDDAIALVQEEEHLRVPIVGRERPAMMEHDRLGILASPVLVEDVDAVGGGHEAR